MRRNKLDCILRPGSVSGADLAMRSVAAQAPDVRFVNDIATTWKTSAAD